MADTSSPPPVSARLLKTVWRVSALCVWIGSAACSDDGHSPQAGTGGYGGFAGWGGSSGAGIGATGGVGGIGGTGGPIVEDAGPESDAGAIDGSDDASAPEDGSVNAGQDGGMDAGDDGGVDAGGVDNALYSLTTPLEVTITMAPADWDALRRQGRNMPLVLSGCDDPNFGEYVEHAAMVSIGGETLSAAEVRKKGFLGSISMYRPSLRIDVGNGTNAHFHGQKHVTLNNNRQDPTHARQCVTYALFERAGLRAPRCGLAHVTVNGMDKGSYTVVEPIEKPMLRRTFGNDSGNLYESTVPADFTAQSVALFELKTNETENDRSDLDRVVAALAVSDDQLLDRLGQVFDLDELFTFWAMEVIVGHWDGLFGDLNNTFLYHDPSDDRLHPMPWGTDQTLLNSAPAGYVRAVYANNALGVRLYAHPEGRQRYVARVRELLAMLWDEDAIMRDVRAIASQSHGLDAAVAITDAWVREQQATLEAALAMNGGRGPDLETRSVIIGPCRPVEMMSGDVDFTWDTSPTAYKPTLGVAMDVSTRDGPVSFGFLSTFQLAAIRPDGQVQMGVAGQDTRSQRNLFVGLIMPPESYHTGTIEFHGFETFGVIAAADTAPGAPTEIFAYMGGTGAIQLTQAGMTVNAPVKGSWQGDAVIAPAPPPN